MLEHVFSTARSRYIYTLRYFLFSASFFSVFCSATPISTAVSVPFGNESGTSESCFMPWFFTCSPYASSRLRSPRTALCVCVSERARERVCVVSAGPLCLIGAIRLVFKVLDVLSARCVHHLQIAVVIHAGLPQCSYSVLSEGRARAGCAQHP